MGWPRPRQVISKVNKDKYAAGLDKQHLRAALSKGPAEIQVMGGFRGRAEGAVPPAALFRFVFGVVHMYCAIRLVLMVWGKVALSPKFLRPPLSDLSGSAPASYFQALIRGASVINLINEELLVSFSHYTFCFVFLLLLFCYKLFN